MSSPPKCLLLSPRYDDPQRRESFFRELQERIQSAPGATSAGFISELPLSGEGNDTFFTITEHPPANPNDNEDADFRVVAGDYFGAMRIPLLAGRSFESQDASEDRQVMVVNEPFAKKFFPHESAIGKHVKLFEGKSQFATREIVGIVGGNKHFALQESLRPEMFIPDSHMRMSVVVRGAGDPAVLTTAVRQALHQIDPDEATSTFRTMTDVVSSSAANDRFNTLLLGAFGAIALLLTAAGIFGVLSYLVTQRTREIGLRMALGAQQADVLRVIVGHGLRLMLLGLGIGVAGASDSDALDVQRFIRREAYRPINLYRGGYCAWGRRLSGVLHSRAPRHARRSHGRAALRVKRAMRTSWLQPKRTLRKAKFE